MNKVLSIGNKVDLAPIEVYMQKEDEIIYLYKSQVFDLLEDDQIKISMPYMDGHIVPSNIGDIYNACFYTTRGLYLCELIVMDRYKEENFYVLIVEPTTVFKKSQRREYYRLLISIPILISYVEEPKEEPKEDSEDEYIKGVSMDISGGGIHFLTKTSIDIGSKLLVKFQLPLSSGKKDYCIEAVVVAFELAVNTRFYEIRIEFSNILVNEREEIIKFVFEKERKQLRHESGIY